MELSLEHLYSLISCLNVHLFGAVFDPNALTVTGHMYHPSRTVHIHFDIHDPDPAMEVLIEWNDICSDRLAARAMAEIASCNRLLRYGSFHYDSNENTLCYLYAMPLPSDHLSSAVQRILDETETHGSHLLEHLVNSRRSNRWTPGAFPGASFDDDDDEIEDERFESAFDPHRRPAKEDNDDEPVHRESAGYGPAESAAARRARRRASPYASHARPHGPDVF